MHYPFDIKLFYTKLQICNAPSDRIIAATGDAPNFYSLCTNGPKISTRNLNLQSKFCPLHASENKKSKMAESPPQIDLTRNTRAFAKKMLEQKLLVEPTKDDEDIGCRSTARIKV